jgi:hypothetical protein
MMLLFCLERLRSIKQKKPVRLVGYRVDGKKNTGLLKIDMVSPRKQLHVFISFAGI